MAERQAMIDRDHSLSVVRQCQLLALSRSSVYYRPMATPPEELALMRLIDELHLQFPWMGSRSLRDQLNRAGIPISRDRVRRVMGKLGIHAIYQKPRTTIPEQGHTIYPYLLRKRVINGPDQVWCADVTYIPMALGFMYLVAVMDWYSRKVLAWQLSNTLTVDFCVAALAEALAHFGPPEIFNTDQGSQFTSHTFTDMLKTAGIAISMDGKGGFLDNVFIERLWRTIKYEEIYLRAYDTVADASAGIGRYLDFYNRSRTHQTLGRLTPDEVYFQSDGLRKAA
jgi:putative transposase